MRHLKTTLAVLGAVTVLALAGNTVAIATTGQGFLLGQANSAGRLTTLTRSTSGPALRLSTHSTANAPLTVNGHGKVAHLNADLLDGLDSTALSTRTSVTESLVDDGNTVGFHFNTPTMPAGHYLATFQAWINGPTTGTNAGIECWISTTSGPTPRFLESWFPYNRSGIYTINVSGVLTLATAQAVKASCDGPQGDYFTPTGQPAQVSLTRIDQFGTTSTLARTAGPR